MTLRTFGLAILGFLLLGAGWIGVEPHLAPADADASVVANAPQEYTTECALISVDGRVQDWGSVPVRRADADDDQGIDIQRVWTAHSDDYLFLRIAVDRSINLQEENDLTLAIDTDNDSTTGRDTLGMGVDFSWTFGEREGQFNGMEIGHAAAGLTSLPTHRSRVFEIALDRAAAPDDSTLLFQSDSLRLAFSARGDRVPDEAGGLGYELASCGMELESPSIAPPREAVIRMLSYNAENNFDRELNALFLEDRQPSFRRILDAVAPDVIGFQEVYDQTASEVEAVAEGALRLPDDWNWAKEGQDLVLGTGFPILGTHSIPGYDEYRSGAFLLDAQSALGRPLVVVVMHPPCCNTPPEDGTPGSDVQRQYVVDGVAAFIRKLKNGDGPFDVAPGTPIAIIGDMNFVGDEQQPRTLRRGEIVNVDRYGPSLTPDWDGSALLDTNPRQTGTPMHTTWVDKESSFPPGRLDYAYVTDSVLDVVHEFVLSTPHLAEDSLQVYGLDRQDTNVASDHLPVVIDVRPR